MASTATTSPVKSPAVSPRRRPKGTVPSSSMDDSSDSDGDEEVSKALHRRVSTSKQLKNKVCSMCICVVKTVSMSTAKQTPFSRLFRLLLCRDDRR